MRVLHFGKYWRKDGGIETHVKSLCKGLADNGLDVVNLVSSIDRKHFDFQIDGYRVIEAPTLGIYFSTAICPSMAVIAMKLHKEKPFNLIHLHFPDPMSHLASMALPASIPRVITWHSDIVKQKYLLMLYRPFQHRAICNAAALVAPTSAHFSSSNQISHNVPQEKKHKIPFGIDFNDYLLTPEINLDAKKIKEKLAKNKFTIFTLGRHVQYKGFNILLDAIAHIDAHLILGGEGPLTEKLKAQARTLGIADRVTFTGRLTQRESIACFHACDVFCLPSITQNEAFGIVQLEAMACGKPIINTKLENGVNELGRHLETSITVKPNNIEDLICGINYLLENKNKRIELGENSRVHVHKSYTIEVMTNSHIELYKKLYVDLSG